MLLIADKIALETNSLLRHGKGIFAEVVFYNSRVGEASAKFPNPASTVTLTSKLNKQHFTATAAKILFTKKKKEKKVSEQREKVLK